MYCETRLHQLRRQFVCYYFLTLLEIENVLTKFVKNKKKIKIKAKIVKI